MSTSKQQPGDAAAAAAAKAAGKKRKRPEQQQQGINLPRIPGIPIEILPLHVQAFKVCSAFFRRHAAAQVVPPFAALDSSSSRRRGDELLAQRESNAASLGASASSVMDVLFHRIERGASQADAQTDSGRERRESLLQMDHTVASWLQVIHRWVRDNNKRQNHRDSQQDQQQHQESPSKDVMLVSVLQHLLKVVVEHRKIHVKRAATHMMGHLLDKSSDCRRWFIEEAEDRAMLAWMDSVSSSNAGVDSTEAAVGLGLWQRESFLLLHHLNSKVSDLYPTLIVALQRFQQLCPTAARETDAVADGASLSVAGASSSSSCSMVERRKVRDVAMLHAETESRRVRKLIARAHACTDILVPRMGIDAAHGVMRSGAETTKPNSSIANGDVGEAKADHPDGIVNSDEEDEDHVEWEDGWENEEKPAVTESETPEVPHAISVENTLAAMRFSGGLTGGEVEIDFSQQQMELVNHQTETHVEESLKLARQRLQQVVLLLEQRHMPRLSSWVDCLTQADSLVEVPEEQQNAAVGVGAVAPSLALISMPPSKIQLRNEVLRRMLDLKREVARVLSSAKRLGLESGVGGVGTGVPNAVAASRPRTITTMNRSSSLQSRHKSLEVSVSRRRVAKAPTDIAHKRNRIQIKYRKD